MATGAELIAQERERQIKEKGWTADHDDQHTDQEIAKAAACYAAPFFIYELDSEGEEAGDEYNFISVWPKRWGQYPGGEEPYDRVRDLVKAGALIAAEIDRLNRLGSEAED